MSKTPYTDSFLNTLYPPKLARVLTALADVVTTSAVFSGKEARAAAEKRYEEAKADAEREP